jgi:hypothetical protein
MSDLKIEVSLIRQYGREEYRPEDPVAVRLAELMRRKVFTLKDIELIKGLGIRVSLKGGEL